MALQSGPPMYTDYPLSILPTPAETLGIDDSFTLEASHMALSHNSFIRGYNSIYQQAPRIKETDQGDFIAYCLAWHAVVEEHHDYEETRIFPAIEKALGQKGLFDHELEQHASFHSGMDEFKGYLSSVGGNFSSSSPSFSSDQLISIMDSFAKPLYTHLEQEPKVLAELRRFSSPDNPLDLVKMAESAGKKSLTPNFLFNVLPVFLLNMETVEFEGGRWHGVFPPLPPSANYVLKVLVPMWQRKRWRFVSCSPDGKIKQLAV